MSWNVCKRLCLGIIIFSLVVLGSCKKDAAAVDAGKIVYTDMLGREVSLSAHVNKIALIRTMDIYKLAAILGDELDDKLVAVGTSLQSTDSDCYKKFSEVFPNFGSLVTLGSIYDDAISLEKVVELDPDIIITDKQFFGKSSLNKMIEAGLPVVFMDCNSDPFHSNQESIRMLGKMLGREKQVNAMVNASLKRTDAVLARIEQLKAAGTPRPTLYFECGNVAPGEIGGTRGDLSNGWGYLWDTLGADNIGAGSGNSPLNPEKVLAVNPDLIVIGGANWNPDANIMRVGFYITPDIASAHLGEYLQRAGWSDLTAVKNKRLYAVHFNYFVHPYDFAGIEAMAQMLYPDQFKDLHPEEDMKAFFAAYMPVKYSGIFSAQWDGR